jgi:hypothetical protein
MGHVASLRRCMVCLVENGAWLMALPGRIRNSIFGAPPPLQWGP